MTITEAAAQVRANTNAIMRGDDLHTLVRDLYGKSTDANVTRFLEDIRYWRLGRQAGGVIQLEPAFVNRLRRDYTGPIRMDNVPLGQALSVVTIDEGNSRWFIAASAAIPTINHWLEEQMAAPAPSASPAPGGPGENTHA